MLCSSSIVNIFKRWKLKGFCNTSDSQHFYLIFTDFNAINVLNECYTLPGYVRIDNAWSTLKEDSVDRHNMKDGYFDDLPDGLIWV